jgi:hypothetical protein
MPLIDDREGIQFALAQILARLTTAQLDPRRANPILYALKLAIWNLHEPRPAARTDSREPISADSNVNDTDDLVEDLILDSDLGPIAPIAEIRPPEPPQPRPTLLDRMIQEFGPINPDPPSLSSRSAPSLSSRSEPSLSSRSAAEGSASPHSPIPQPAQSEAAKTQSEAVIPTEAAGPASPHSPIPQPAQSEAVKTQSEAVIPTEAAGPASPHSPIPQPAQSEAVKTQSEAVIPTGAADGCIVRRAVEGPPHLNSNPATNNPQPATCNPQPATVLPTLQATAHTAPRTAKRTHSIAQWIAAHRITSRAKSVNEPRQGKQQTRRVPFIRGHRSAGCPTSRF